MDRRKFIATNGLAFGSLLVAPPSFSKNFIFNEGFVSRRPPLSKRTFVSDAVEECIVKVKSSIADKEIAWMFENCYPNTLDTTVDFEVIDEKPDSFIITGDIDAMWLRDSTAQVWPYMPLITKEKKLQDLILGLVNRQVKCILNDPYANAFYKDLNRNTYWVHDEPTVKQGVHERKWEIDSLCYVIRLSSKYYEISGDQSVLSKDWDKAMRTIVQTFKTEQRKDGSSPYYFKRESSNPIDSPAFGGKGNPIKPNGLICSMFRPSDDATFFPFLIPSNIFAAISLRQLGNIYKNVIKDPVFALECLQIANEIEAAINKHAIVQHQSFGEIYAYEVDGFGNSLFMDDANVPSLMSLAYLEPSKINDTIYQNTRKFLLSNANPYFLKGKAAQGQASPHTGLEKIWPMGIILRAMTSNDNAEIYNCLLSLKNTHAGTGFMHEAFNKDNPEDYTRSWFAWANTLFGELIIKIYNERKDILNMKFD